MMAAANESLVERHGATLLEVAATAIDYGLRQGREMPVDAAAYPPDLRTPGAAFVTLAIAGRLRGCIGSLEPFRPLVEDVAGNAHAAAFRDSRFRPLEKGELEKVRIEISVLSPLAPAKISGIKPGTHGAVVSKEGRSGLFLPQVWEQLPQPEEFLTHLCVKMGASGDLWRRRLLDVKIYTVEEFHE